MAGKARSAAKRELLAAAGIAVDGALFVAGGTVLLLFGDGREVCDVVFGGHGHRAEEETGEGGVLVEYGAALRVDVEDVEGDSRGAGPFGKTGFDAAKEQLQDGGFEGMEEKGESGGAAEVEGESVLLVELDGRELRGSGVGGMGFDPEIEIALSDVGHLGIQLDADDLFERQLAGDQHGATLAGADVDEGVVVDGVGRDCLAPEVDERAQDAGRDTVVGGDELVVGVAGDEVSGGDEAAGIDPVGEIEGVDGSRGELQEILRTLAAARRLGDENWFGGHRLADLDKVGVAVEAKDAASGGSDVLRRPGWRVEDVDVGMGDGLKPGQAIGDLSAEMGFCGFSRVRGDEVDADVVLLRDAGDAGAGSVEVRCENDALDEAEVDDIAGKVRVVAVAQGGQDIGFVEHVSVCARPGIARGTSAELQLRQRARERRRRRR
jgi:hypothetical protein